MKQQVLVRASVPEEWHRRLAVLAVEHGRSRADMAAEAILLLLHHCRRGGGLPDPIDAASPPETERQYDHTSPTELFSDPYRKAYPVATG